MVTELIKTKDQWGKMKNKKYKAFCSFSSPLWTDSPSLGSHSSGLPSMRCCLLLGNIWDQFRDLNSPGGEHHQTFKKKSLHQEKNSPDMFHMH